MKYRKDISGVKFGRLTAVSFNRRENGYTYWNYKCDCGNEVIRASYHVNRGSTRSCGCLNKDWLGKLAKLQTLKDNQSCRNRLYRNYKRAAISRGFTFDLTIEDFEHFLDKPCYYCGNSFGNEIKQGKKGVLRYNGIDRTNNFIGYTVKNCVTCCYKCNKMKMNLDEKEFLEQINKIYNFKNE